MKHKNQFTRKEISSNQYNNNSLKYVRNKIKKQLFAYYQLLNLKYPMPLK